MQTDLFIQELKKIDTTNDIFQFVFKEVNVAFRAGEFAEVDKVFSTLDPSTLSVAANVALLSYSGVAKKNLPARATYFQAAFEDAKKRIGSEAYGIFGPIA